jgi:hypothetical protein
MSNILNGLGRDFTKGFGGLKAVYLAPYQMISGQTITLSGGTTNVASFQAPVNAFKRYVFGKESKSEFTESLVTNVASASQSVESTLTMVFRRNEAVKRNEAKIIAATEVIAIIEDNNGYIYVAGFMNGMDQTTAAPVTGALYADANNLTLTLKGLEQFLAPTLTSTDWLAVQNGTAITT